MLPLSFSVTYWDRFGWRDPLARPEFTERQYAYARTGRREAGTPQFVVNGRFATPYRGDAALESLRREHFVPETHRDLAFADIDAAASAKEKEILGK